MFPATTSNQITYDYFCTLGGLAHPHTAKIARYNGSHLYYTYHLISVR